MIALAFALNYVGWAALCFAMPSHARGLRGRPFSHSVVFAMRIAGGVALLLALLATVSAWGWPIGTTAWFGILTIACLFLMGLLAVNPRAALLPLLCLPVAIVCILLR